MPDGEFKLFKHQKNHEGKRNEIPFLSVLCGPELNASVFQL